MRESVEGVRRKSKGMEGKQKGHSFLDAFKTSNEVSLSDNFLRRNRRIRDYMPREVVFPNLEDEFFSIEPFFRIKKISFSFLFNKFNFRHSIL